MAIRTMDKAIHSLTRALPKVFNAGASSIGTASPLINATAMAKAGNEGIVTLAIDAGAGNRTITCWTRSKIGNQWFRVECAPGVYTKAMVAGSMAAFAVPEGSDVFFTADANIADSFVDGDEPILP